MMWLPEPIYKSLPTLYGVMGILFIIGVIYLGFDTPMSPVYLGLGLVSLIASLGLAISRGKRRRSTRNAESDDTPTA